MYPGQVLIELRLSSSPTGILPDRVSGIAPYPYPIRDAYIYARTHILITLVLGCSRKKNALLYDLGHSVTPGTYGVRLCPTIFPAHVRGECSIPILPNQTFALEGIIQYPCILVRSLFDYTLHVIVFQYYIYIC